MVELTFYGRAETGRAAFVLKYDTQIAIDKW